MSTFSCSEELFISETAPIDFVMILDMFFFIVSMASIGLEACFVFVSGHTHDVPGWYLGCIEDMHRCRPQAVVCTLLAGGSLLAKDRHHHSCK